jgi:hypothetical protein
MPVTDSQAAVLRAQLSGHLDEADRLLRQFSNREDLQGFFTLITAAFSEAAELRYGSGGTREDAIRLTAEVRSRSDRLSVSIDPETAERVMMAAFTDGDVSDIDRDELRSILGILLSAMLAEEHFDDAQLDAFTAKARALADELLTINAT